MEVNFCSACGKPMETRDIDGTERKACTSCSFVHWGNYSIGVGALVEREGKLLLVRRAQEPGRGFWTNPGGYAEQLEQLHETVRREVIEETGIEAVVTGVAALRDEPRLIHNLYVAYSMEYVAGEPVPDGLEVDAAGFFSREEMESMNVASFTRWLADVALSSHSEGLRLDDNPIVPLNGIGLFRVVKDAEERNFFS